MNTKRTLTTIKTYILPLLVLFSFTNLSAQTTDTGIALQNQDTIQLRNQMEDERRAMERKKQQIAREAESLMLQRSEQEKSSGANEKTVFVKKIEVVDNKKNITKKLNKIIQDFENRSLTKTDIENIQIRLQNLYMEKGYVTARVYIDFSRIDDGVLLFAVIRGRLDKIIFSDGKKHCMEKFTAFPFTQKRILNIRDIEQGMEQMNRLASNNVTMDIIPGEKENETIIEIRNQKTTRNRLNLGVDNSGMRESQYRYSIGMENDNVFKLNDSFYVNYSAGMADSKETYNRNLYAAFAVPFGYWRVNSAYSRSDYLNTVEGIAGKIASSGSTDDIRLGLERILMRGQFYKTNIGAGINKKTTESYLNGEFLKVGSRVLAPAELYFDNTFYMKKGSAFARFSYVKGLNALGATKDPADIQDGEPKAQYQKITFSGYFSRRQTIFKFPLNYSLSARGQYGFDDLFGSEQFSPMIRALKDGSIAAETGYSINNDLKANLINILPFFKGKTINTILNSLSIGIFYDIGYVYPKTYGDKESVEGYGFSFSGYFGDYVSFTCSIGSTTKVPQWLKHEKNVVSANLNVNIPLF
jgi:hemolysin activation/secretion protein